MATLYSDLANSNTAYSPKSLADGSLYSAPANYIVATMSFDGTQVDEDDVMLARVPAGTVINVGASFLETDGTMGATATMNVGTETSASVLATALDTGTAGFVAFDGASYKTTVAEFITADIEAIGTPAAGVVTFYIAVIFP